MPISVWTANGARFFCVAPSVTLNMGTFPGGDHRPRGKTVDGPCRYCSADQPQASCPGGRGALKALHEKKAQ
ncbi:MAG: hypothetical protein ACJAVR_001821 [Paracoccaceae bacterium]|jgi:hypothetical protein